MPSLYSIAPAHGEFFSSLLAQIEARDARIATLTKEKQLLQERIDHLLRKIYGAKSEKADLFQLQLLMQELHSPGPAMGAERSETG